MFYYKLFTPLCNCFLFPCSHFKHLKIYHLIFSIGITPLTFYYFTGIPQCFLLAAPCRSGSALRSIMHLIFRFLSLHTQGKHTFGILASLPPRFLHTVAYGMCSVPPHIPYPSASLRERSYASVALQPLPATSTFPFSSHLLFLKIFFSMR